MNLKFAVCLGTTLLVLSVSTFALDPEKQAAIDRYKEPFTIYLAAIDRLGTALGSAKTDADVIKAADKFCDEANKFVDDFNANKEMFENSPVVRSMDDDADAKKAMEDYLESLKTKLEDARPIFDRLIKALNRDTNSTEFNRVRDRVAATFQRLQLIYS